MRVFQSIDIALINHLSTKRRFNVRFTCVFFLLVILIILSFFVYVFFVFCCYLGIKCINGFCLCQDNKLRWPWQFTVAHQSGVQQELAAIKKNSQNSDYIKNKNLKSIHCWSKWKNKNKKLIYQFGSPNDGRWTAFNSIWSWYWCHCGSIKTDYCSLSSIIIEFSWQFYKIFYLSISWNIIFHWTLPIR